MPNAPGAGAVPPNLTEYCKWISTGLKLSQPPCCSEDSEAGGCHPTFLDGPASDGVPGQFCGPQNALSL